MTNTALKLLKEAAKRGWSFKVGKPDDGGWTGEGYDYEGKGPVAAWNAVKEVGESDVDFFDGDGKRIGWAYLMAPGAITCSPEESLVDHTMGGEFGALADSIIDSVL
jgi:hypothetical protein